ncbi:MAG: glycosyltransferase, partial [Muribaculaceae bacterium]|nr:glycosyltransferase [Muribaculaceae bacterium]
MHDGWESMIAYGRHSNPSESQLVRIGSGKDIKIHGLTTRLFDRHGLESTKATRAFIKVAEDYNPDIIHLHNIHGYYLNYPILFRWLKEIKKPVVWTFHDCWPWTGHCAYYTYNRCEKWKTECSNCPGLNSYTKS